MDTQPALDGLVRLTSGLWASQTLVAAEDLGLFTFLSGGSATPAEVAAGTGIAERPAEILLTACAALDLLDADGGRFRNTPVAEAYLVKGKPDYFGDYIRMLGQYANPGWMRVTEIVRANRPGRLLSGDQEEIFEEGTRPRIFWDGLYPLSAGTARVLAEEVDFGETSTLLDVGGGGGAFAVELCRRHPGLHTTIFDLPFVCEYTVDKVEEAKLSDRISLRSGDFLQDAELPPGHDAILLSMILHDWDEARNAELLAKCHRALPSGGLLVISELLVDDDKAGPADAALMSMAMLVGTWGRNYTAAEYHEWLTAAGFDDIRTVRFQAPGANGAITARKP
ncbi:methyltransferase [Amycolatopsis roodepoortensis]|uniref:Ubiquinone/menaquinone biosynthesis C-methylase UbiE n=1 Tax=Amycolatopsis roodepoortensis TaxID=700274 RepID=A0ABR9L6P1_9PSEU|nr:methyltransferase [Amycolatopsis roodepoortensis]MBE1576290.1 ubiquinone/menaquinone biosynthesis C-methylase UbiE [Amycolatopsis roodepoortensis]